MFVPLPVLTKTVGRPIDVFVTYDGKRAADIAVSRYAVRHLVAGEVSGSENFATVHPHSYH